MVREKGLPRQGSRDECWRCLMLGWYWHIVVVGGRLMLGWYGHTVGGGGCALIFGRR